MSHFGFIAPPFLGHLNPMRALAEALVARGHAVSILGLAETSPLFAGSALRFITLDSGQPAGGLAYMRAHMAAPRGLGLFRVIGDMARMADLVCQVAPELIKAGGIDALVVDQLEPAGALVAEHLELPFVSVANALPIDREPAIPPPFTDWVYDPSPWGLRRNVGGYRVADAMMGRLGRIIAKWAAAWGLAPRRRIDECLSPILQLTQLVPGFDFPRHGMSDAVRHCGPFRGRETGDDAGVWPGADSRPLVFASLGTLQGGRFELFRRIALACQDLNLRLVIAHGGGLTPSQAESLPGAPIVRSFVAQRAVLARAALAVTNGGLNTVLDALAAGVPLVTIPIAFEQGAIGARLEACGAGLVIRLRQAGVARLTSAISTTLSDRAMRIAAGRLRAEIADAGGVAEAAGLIEAAVRRGSVPGSAPALQAHAAVPA